MNVSYKQQLEARVPSSRRATFLLLWQEGGVFVSAEMKPEGSGRGEAEQGRAEVADGNGVRDSWHGPSPLPVPFHVCHQYTDTQAMLPK